MSTAPTTPAAPPPSTPPVVQQDKVIVISHSNIFYWWPVWAIGFVMGIWTLAFDRHVMVTIPHGTEKNPIVVATDATVNGKTAGEVQTFTSREVVIAPKDSKLPRRDSKDVEPSTPRVHMARSKNLGVFFCVTLLLVITITNVPLRGMWSVVVIITVVMMTIIFALAGWLEQILTTLHYLDIRINAGGYFFISGVLLAVWLVAFFFFDRQTYTIFEPGQFRVCTEIGGGEKVYPTIGMTLERQKGDIFRHYILGLGSGDLVVKTTGAQAHHFDLSNVLFIRKKVQQIEDVIRKVKQG